MLRGMKQPFVDEAFGFVTRGHEWVETKSIAGIGFRQRP